MNEEILISLANKKEGNKLELQRLSSGHYIIKEFTGIDERYILIPEKWAQALLTTKEGKI